MPIPADADHAHTEGQSSDVGPLAADPSAVGANATVATPRNDRHEGTRFSDIIYEKIFAKIASGEFPLNERLPSETSLANLFGASRPVVREALERLRNDGLIVSRKGSGSYVRQRPDVSVLQQVPVGSLAEVQRFFEFRAGLESSAAELAARNAQPPQRSRITQALAQLEETMLDGGLGADEDIALHLAIAEASNNPFHLQVYTSFRPHFLVGQSVTRSLSMKRSPERMRAVHAEHQAIVEAILARDEAGAVSAMKDHILKARNRMFQGLEG